MKYLSLFSGIGAGEQAIKELGLDWECIGYSENDPYQIKVYKKHFPDHKNFGDISEIDIEKLPDFDLIFGGSPCQGLSIAKNNRKGLEDSRSNLFYKFAEILKVKKPKYFLLENVASMPKKDKQIITDILGVDPIMIDAALVSAQQRKRLFWCNWKIEQPEDRGIYLKDIIHELRGEKFDLEKYIMRKDRLNIKYHNKGLKLLNEKANSMTATMYKGFGNDGITTIRIGEICKGGQGDRIYDINGKIVCLSTSSVRKLTPIECERLQCFPDNFTEIGIENGKEVRMSNTRRYKALGNSFNVEVIKHILKPLIK